MRATLYRQGDVLIRPIDEVPGGKRSLRRKDDAQRRIVLAHGELTGHAHVIEADATEAVLRERRTVDGARRFLEVLTPTGVELRHDEHETITLPPGDYEILRQREYTPTAPVRVSD